MSRKAVIVGGGLGGLSCAIGLAVEGFDVTLTEKESVLGGKLKRVEKSGYRFDRGPSTITMLHAFRRVFERAGKRMEDYIETYELEPRTRNVFFDGTTVDLSRDVSRMREQIAAYSPDDASRAAVPLLQAPVYAGDVRALRDLRGRFAAESAGDFCHARACRSELGRPRRARRHLRPGRRHGTVGERTRRQRADRDRSFVDQGSKRTRSFATGTC